MFKKFVVLLMLFISITVTGCSSSGGNNDNPDIDPPVEPQTKTLKELKDEARFEINNYVDKSLYRAFQVSEIEELISKCLKDIDGCRDKDLLKQIVDECKVKLSEIKTDAELTREEEEAEEENKKYKYYNYMNKEGSYNILFVGSSYMYYCDQYRILENILDGEGFDVTVDEVFEGKATLEMFADETNKLYGNLQEKLESTQYDYIFLEELSTRPLKKYDLFEKAVGDLVERIDTYQKNAEVLLFEVWARDERCDWYQDNKSYTYDKMEEELLNAYNQVADKYGLRVSYPGLSFQNVYNNFKDINLYNEDYSHPNINGAYLAALNHYNTLTGLDSAEVSYYPVNFEVITDTASNRGKFLSISEEDAAILKGAVKNTCEGRILESLNVYVWASNSGTSYYTDLELEDFKKNLVKKAKKNLIFNFHIYRKISKEDFKNYMANVKDADVILAGANMDTDCGISLLKDEESKKILIAKGWTNNSTRYIGVASTVKNLTLALLLRTMLSTEKELKNHKNVLFIGNSYTFYNDMYIMFNELCQHEEIDATAYKVTLGSRKLIDYANNDATTEDLKDKLNNIKFDYIYLQEQSSLPVTNFNNYKNGVNTVINLINKSELNKDAKVLIYGTWARHESDSFYDSHYTNYTDVKDRAYQMMKELALAYKSIGQQFNLDVSYCGIGVYEVHRAYPDMILYHTDHTHPSPLTSYMVALINCAKIFNIDPREVTYLPIFTNYSEGACTPVTPTLEEARILREEAYKIVYELDINTYFN